MTEEQIVEQALKKLLQTTQLSGLWERGGVEQLDGTLRVNVDGRDLRFNVEVKSHMRAMLLPQILEYNKAYPPFLLIATRIAPEIKEELRSQNIAYLEANGNFHLKTPDTWIWIDANKPVPLDTNVKNRAFTKTGVQVLFDFLRDGELINQPYRQIAEQTGTSIGNITHIINGLKQEGFLVRASKDAYCFKRTDDLLGRWATAYTQNLKPSLKMGSFRFLDRDRFTDWENLTLDVPKTLWGGESAGALLTDYLKPAQLTLYTGETRGTLIKKYRLLPDEEGSVLAYKKFWRQEEKSKPTVPPLLVYADLISTHERRCHETAQKIYDAYVQTELP